MSNLEYMMKLDSMIYMCVFNAARNSFYVQTVVNKSPTMNSNFWPAINLAECGKDYVRRITLSGP
jgi:hypothetical protein